MITKDDIFKWLVKECHLSPRDIGELTDDQIRILLRPDKKQ